MGFGVRLRWTLIDKRIAASGGMMAVTQRAGLDRSTVSRWRNGSTLPNDPLKFLRLAQALDIDPLLLFELEEQRFASLCFQVGRLLLRGELGAALRSLSFVEQFWMCAGDDWPPSTIQSGPAAIGYEWRHAHLDHDGQIGRGPSARNFYASILLDSQRVASRAGPQTWHFAYRDRAGSASLWHPYGSVALVDDQLELYAYQGRVQREAAPGAIAVQTWFGEGDAEFRIASLHPFQADLARDLPKGRAVVRFSLPRRQDGAATSVAQGG